MLLLAGALAGILLSPPSPQATREAARRILEMPEYQKSIPVPRETGGDGELERDRANGRERGDGTNGRMREGVGGRGGRRRVGDRLPVDTGPETGGRSSSGSSGFGSALGKVLMWAVIAVVGILCLVWLAKAFRRVERDVKPSPAPAAPSADPRVVLRPLTAAETLAAEAKYGEAIHALLLQTLSALVATSPVAVPRSMTTREILGRVTLPGESRAALATLAESSEVCWFGGRPAGKADYERCADHFRRFAAAYSLGPA